MMRIAAFPRSGVHKAPLGADTSNIAIPAIGEGAPAVFVAVVGSASRNLDRVTVPKAVASPW